MHAVISKSSHERVTVEGETLPELVEAIFGDARYELGLSGTAGYRLHGVEISSAVAEQKRWHPHPDRESPTGKYHRVITVAWQAMQTLPQERSGAVNPVETKRLTLEHDEDAAGCPAYRWAPNAAGQLEAVEQ